MSGAGVRNAAGGAGSDPGEMRTDAEIVRDALAGCRPDQGVVCYDAEVLHPDTKEVIGRLRKGFPVTREEAAKLGIDPERFATKAQIEERRAAQAVAETDFLDAED